MLKTPPSAAHLFLIIAMTSSQVFAVSDSERERFFHEIYTKYNSSPTPSETWDRMVSKAQINVYQVQGGDTLWDISNTLFADPQFWPKLWAENSKKIFNPHQIEPGQEILFYGGSVSSPPYFAPKSTEESPLATNTPGKSSSGETKKKKTVPVLEKIPPSFAELKIFPKPVEFPKLDPDFGKRNIKEPESPLTAYISEESVDKIKSQIADVEQGSETALLGDVVFVELEEPVQSIYHVVSSSNLTDLKGPQLITVHGQVEILGKASSKKPIYKARVTQALNQIFKGYKLLSGPAPYFSTTSEGRPSSIRAKVIGGQLPKNQIMSLGQLAFIDAGESQGLSEGDLLTVFLNPNLRVGRDISDMNYKPIGLIKIIQKTANFSTAYILHVSDDIRVGDWVGLQGASASEDEEL